MAKVVVKVLGGGSPSDKEANTVGELKTEMGLASYTASVNGKPVSDDYELSDDEFVSFSASVKGG